MHGTKLTAALPPDHDRTERNDRPPPDGAHAVGASLRPPSGRPPLRAHRVPRRGPRSQATRSTTGFAGRAAISPAYPTCQPRHHECVPAGHRQLRDHQHRPRTTLADDLRHRRPAHDSIDRDATGSAFLVSAGPVHLWLARSGSLMGRPADPAFCSRTYPALTVRRAWLHCPAERRFPGSPVGDGGRSRGFQTVSERRRQVRRWRVQRLPRRRRG